MTTTRDFLIEQAGQVRVTIRTQDTDEPGFHVVDRPVHVHDVQATILHCLGIDHRRLTFRLNGLNFRLTGVEQHDPVKELLA